MSIMRIYAMEAWHELRAGLRTSLVPLMFVGLVGYLFMMLLNAEYLRQMGGADVARNSPHVIFQMTSGQSFWLVFAWAWVFAQVVTRDRTASLHELVLTAPVSLRGLLLSRYAGALGLAVILGSSSSIGFLLVPGLAKLGAFPPEAVGPTPYAAITWAWILFVVPSALGLGALYLAAALRTRSSAGPFAVAAVVILVWMIAMVVLRGGSVHADIATVLDVSGFGEAEAQTKRWTPHEKATAQLALSAPLLLNRLLWTAIPAAILGWAIHRQRREALVLERAIPQKSHAPPKKRISTKSGILKSATLSEARWHLMQATKGWAFRVAIGLWTLMNVAGAFYHMVGHADGPFVPRAAILAPFLLRLSYVFSLFTVAGFVGALVRRDDRAGFDEMIDATPAPLGTRVLGRALAALGLTFVLALLPTLSNWIVVGLTVPSTFEPWTALLVNALVAAPPLLELGALTFLVHALVRSSGTAYALSMLVAFIALLNHELDIVSYPVAQVGVPVHIALSEFSGWSPWLGPVLQMACLKMSVVAFTIALAWLAHARGTAITWLARWRDAARRLRQGAGLLGMASFAAFVVCTVLLRDRIVVQSGFASKTEQNASDAAWEKSFWAEASPFSVEGGRVEATIHPSERSARITWQLRGVRTARAKLHGALRTGMRIEEARVDGSPRDVVEQEEHFMLDLGSCPDRGCNVQLNITVAAPGWFEENEAPWLDGSGVWARAADLLPRLGIDGERALRSPSMRRNLGLPEQPSPIDAKALVPMAGVAPAGDWHWSVSFSEQDAADVKGANSTTTQGDTHQGLDFAVAWLPEGAALHERHEDGLMVWHGATHVDTAREVLDDVRRMRECIGTHLGTAPEVTSIVQAPRERGKLEVHGAMVWLPESEGWDIASSGVGRSTRRAALAQALAARWLADRADARAEPGARWLLDGVAGWLGLECVRAADGVDPWLALLARRSDRVADSLGALDAPLSSLARDGDAKWVPSYAPLETLAWAQSVGPAEAVRAATRVADRVRLGDTVQTALEKVVGPETSRALLGPPAASELTVTPSETGGPQARGQRFHWEKDGWQPDAKTFDALQRFDDDATPTRRTQLPATFDPQTPFVVFDARPSFERSPRDNAWRAGAR
ncbi:hypothetical protein LVJ94_39420 [Pendulispora rubella]|uniref:ABC transporter permease n=1 Tax=Pendulispora rubella TaxID=2741070 RepID=A0ABZ2L144_9BACT|nr:SrbP [Sorangiineae bacterium]